MDELVNIPLKGEYVGSELSHLYKIIQEMKRQCVTTLGTPLYNKICQYIRTNKRRSAGSCRLEDKLKELVGDDKEKIKKANLISQIIEFESKNL